MSDEPKYPTCFHPWDLEPHYSEHIGAMTSEGLHDKSDIALQLAWRDKRIADLETALARTRAQLASQPSQGSK